MSSFVTENFKQIAAGALLTTAAVFSSGFFSDGPTDHKDTVFFGEEEFALGVDRDGSVKAYDIDPDTLQEQCIESQNCVDYADLHKGMNKFLQETGYPNIETAYEIQLKTFDDNQREAARAFADGVEPIIADQAPGWDEFRDNYELYRDIQIKLGDLPHKVVEQITTIDNTSKYSPDDASPVGECTHFCEEKYPNPTM